jgi:hypothetical protein
MRPFDLLPTGPECIFLVFRWGGLLFLGEVAPHEGQEDEG